MSESKTTGKLTVRGEGHVTATPDIADITIVVEVRGATTAEAYNSARQATAKIAQALSKSKVDRQELKVSSVDVRPEYQTVTENGQTTRKMVGYLASENYSVSVPTADDIHVTLISNVAKLCPEARAALSFRLGTATGLEKEALRLAAKNAASSAKVLAKSLDVSIVGIESIVKDDSPAPYAPRRAMMMAAAVNDQANPAELEVTAGVTVTFLVR